MPDLAGPLAALVMLLLLSGFFSSAETALTGVSRIRIRNSAQRGDRRAAVVLRLVDEPDRLLSAILLGNNFVNVAASALATTVALRLAGANGVAVATVVMTALILIFSEIAPKTYAARHPERLALSLARPVDAVVRLLHPLAAAAAWIADRLLAPLGGDRGPGHPVSEDEIKGMLDLGVEQRVIARQKRRMLHAVFELGDTTIEDIMIPRTDVHALALDTETDQVLRFVRSSGHTRFPVYESSLDDIVGILHSKDLLPFWDHPEKLDIRKLLRRPIYVPETASLETLLRLFQRHRQHLAVVIDEFDGVEGIVTLEDMLEEIVGDIVDEHDEVTEPEVDELPDGSFMARGDCALGALERRLRVALPVRESSTLAGFLMEISGRVPLEGDRLQHGDFCFEILRARRNRIESVHIVRDGEGPDRQDG